MTKIQEVFEALCKWAPLSLQMDFDNAGFQIGRGDRPVTRVLLALDVTDPVAQEAKELGAELIISHHPLLFHAAKSITDADPAMDRLLRLAEDQIAVISMHTNLDIADGGVNDVLIRLLGAEPESSLDASGCGRIGELPSPCEMVDFLARCKDRLQVSALRYYDAGKNVHRLAVMGGAGGDSLEDAWRMGCDTYVTADVKYHQFLRAEELGINLIDGDHFCTEHPVIPALRDRLDAAFPEVEFLVSRRHGPTIRFF